MRRQVAKIQNYTVVWDTEKTEKAYTLVKRHYQDGGWHRRTEGRYDSLSEALYRVAFFTKLLETTYGADA